MKKKNIRKLIAITACTAALFTVGGTLAACGGDYIDPDIVFVEEEKKSGPQFLEGALDVVTVGDTVRLDYYIDYVDGAKYTITLTDEAGKKTDLTRKKIWKAEEAGVYVITYTINSGKYKGTNTFTLTVEYPELKWEFMLQNQPYLFGDTMNIAEYLEGLNIYVYDRPEEDFTVQMDGVIVDGVETSLEGVEEYTFNSMSDHTFKFSATTVDGQRIEAREVISVKYIDTEYMQELTEMGISIHGELRVQDGNYTMVAGSYANGNNVWLRRANGPHKSPYIAYNGNYGIGSYVTVEFTGDNMPIFSFFRDEYSQSMFDGSKGWVFTGGFKNNSGAPIHESMCARNVIYGPYMMNEYDRSAEDTQTFGAMAYDNDANGNVVVYPGSLKSLQAGTRYRVIVGFSDLKVAKGVPHHIDKTKKVDSFKLTLSYALINLDTQELVTKFDLETYAIQACDRLLEMDVNDMEAALAYFSGSIVLYGNYGETTTIDKIYPIITNTEMSFDELFADEFAVSEFKEDAPTFITNANEVLNVSAFIENVNDGYLFFYRDENGNIVNVTKNTFSFGQAGSYTLYYSDGKKLCATHNVFVADYSDEVLAWIAQNNVSLYGIDQLTDGAAITLKAGTLASGGSTSGPNPGNYVDQGYIAFNGNYDFDDFIAFDFTGKNMPEVAFFAQNYNNSMYYQNGGKQGILFANGITNYDGSVNTNSYFLGGSTQVNIDSPFMMQNLDTWFVENGSQTSALARANLQDGTQYRVILGFTYEDVIKSGRVDRTVPVLHWSLYNLTTGELVEEKSIATWNFFTGKNAKVNNMTVSDLFGSIVLYGKFGVETQIDKLYGVFENTTIEKIANALSSNATYTVTFADENGATLQTVQVAAGDYPVYTGNVPTLQVAEDALFTYAYGWDTPLARAVENVTYTRKLVATLKKNAAVTKYKTSITNGTIVLDAGVIGNGANYTQGQQIGGSVDQAYLALDGSYSFGDYLVLDFTGWNMPEVAFFAKNYNNSMYAEGVSKQGIVVASGITLWDGSLNTNFGGNTQVWISGPHMANYVTANSNVGGNLVNAISSKLARANLAKNTRYRVVMGFELKDESTLVWNCALYNLDTNTLEERISQETYPAFNNPNFCAEAASTLSGAIVLYGKFDGQVPITATTTIDRLWGVYENTSIDEIFTSLGMNQQ